MPASKEFAEAGCRLVDAAREFIIAAIPDIPDERRENLQRAINAGDVEIVVKTTIRDDDPRFKITALTLGSSEEFIIMNGLNLH